MNRLTNALLKTAIRILCKVDDSELKKVPEKGPMIIIANHISFFEAPIIYLYLRPRRTIALAKKELWDSFATRKLMEWWESIPINRGSMDRDALRKSFQVLDDGDFFCIAPEGTRSRTGQIQRGKEGTAFIATKKDAPILPVAHFGIENFTKNIKRLRRTPVTFKVGKPFVITEKRRFSAQERQQISDEMMRRLASLLPEHMQGCYKDSIHDEYRFTREVDKGS